MSKLKKDSMAAFPKISGFGGESGMSLRDYFAAKAMQGLLAGDIENNLTFIDVAQMAYGQADSMLRERGE